MINELYSLLLGWDEVGGRIAVKHKDLQSPGRGPTLRVLLADSGEVAQVETMDRADLENCWTIGDGNKNQFPAVKLEYPFKPQAHEAYKQWKKGNKRPSIDSYLNILESLKGEITFDQSKQTSWPKYREKIESRYENLKELEHTEAAIVCLLYRRYLNAAENGLSILRGVSDSLWQLCCERPNATLLNLAGSIYFGDEMEKGRVKDGKRVTLMLDVVPNGEGLHNATSNHWIPFISGALSKTKIAKTKPGRCAITGNTVSLIADKFPREKLPVIGLTNLFSKYDGSGNFAVSRYRRTKTDAYTLGTELAGKLAATLSAVTSPKYEGKTWASLASENQSRDLLIAYCKSSLELDPVKVITGYESEDSPGDVTDFVEESREVIESFQGRSRDVMSPVHFFVVRKIDDGNQKIIYSTTRSVNALIQASSSWSLGCKNVPSVTLAVYFQKTKKTHRCNPWHIPPLRMVELLRKQYTFGQKKQCDVPGVSFSEVMGLFFSDGPEVSSIAWRTMKRLFRQYSALLERIAVNKHYGKVTGSAEKTSLAENADALSAISAIGLTFFKSSRTMEQTMDDLAFKLGQFFSALDDLHCGYYFYHNKKVTKLPKLIGNQAYSTALVKPKSALSNLSRRYSIYQKWLFELQKTGELAQIRTRIKGAQDSDKSPKDSAVSNAGYAGNWLKQISPEIERYSSSLSDKPSDLFRTELLLGYVTGRPYPEAKKQNESPTEAESQGVKP